MCLAIVNRISVSDEKTSVNKKLFICTVISIQCKLSMEKACSDKVHNVTKWISSLDTFTKKKKHFPLFNFILKKKKKEPFRNQTLEDQSTHYIFLKPHSARHTRVKCTQLPFYIRVCYDQFRRIPGFVTPCFVLLNTFATAD